jgi:hypothetical protein
MRNRMQADFPVLILINGPLSPSSPRFAQSAIDVALHTGAFTIKGESHAANFQIARLREFVSCLRLR